MRLASELAKVCHLWVRNYRQRKQWARPSGEFRA
jgi:hypothetical protein